MKRRKVKEVSPEELARETKAQRRFALESVLDSQRRIVLEKQRLLASLLAHLTPRSSLSSDEAAKGKAASPGSSDISLTGWIVPHPEASTNTLGEPPSTTGELRAVGAPEGSVSDQSHRSVLVAETPRVHESGGGASSRLRVIPETPFDERGFPVANALPPDPEDSGRIAQLESEIRATERMLRALDARINSKLGGN